MNQSWLRTAVKTIALIICSRRPAGLWLSLLQALLVLLVATPSAVANDWPEWRGGPARDGHWSDPTLPSKLPDAGPMTVWKHAIGSGFGGPAVADGRIFVMDRLEGTNGLRELERILCFDAHLGTPLWTNSYPCTLRLPGGYANGPRTTPTVRDGRVYALGGMGNFWCLDAATGSVIWAHDLLADFHIDLPSWGMANSPWIEGDSVIIQAGGTNSSTVIAFNRGTGKEVWHSLSDKAGYASIFAIESGHTRQLIVWTGSYLNSIDPKDGHLFWQKHRSLRWDQAVATPVFDPSAEQLIVCSDREGSLVLQLDRDKPGFTQLRDDFSMSALHSTPLLKGHYLFGINHNGDRLEHCGEFRSVELATGKVAWTNSTVTKLGRWAQAHVTLNEPTDTFYITNEWGELVLAKADPQGYHELSRAQITGKTWAHPAYANHCIFTRTEDTLSCLSLN